MKQYKTDSTGKQTIEASTRTGKIGTLIELLEFLEVKEVKDLKDSKVFRVIVETIQEESKEVLFLGCSTNGDKLDLVFPNLIASIALVNNCPICIRTSKLFKM